MGKLNQHPYSYDPYQRQGLENIMLRPIGVGASSRGVTNFPLLTNTVVGYHTIRKTFRDVTIVDGAPLSYAGPWDYRGFQITSSNGRISFGIDPGQTSKSQNGTFTLSSGFLDKNLNTITASIINAVITISQSFTSTSTTGTASMIVTNQNVSFGDDVSGYLYDMYSKSYSSGSVSSTTLSGTMGSGYVRVSTRFKAINIKPMPMLSI